MTLVMLKYFIEILIYCYFMQLLIVYVKTAQKGDLVIMSDKILSFNTKLYLSVCNVL
jgi:hypothetical protein